MSQTDTILDSKELLEPGHVTAVLACSLPASGRGAADTHTLARGMCAWISAKKENSVCKGTGVMGQNGAILGEAVKEDVSEKVTSEQHRHLREVRDIWRKSCSNRGNCKCKGPEGECAIYSDGERLVGSR